MKIGYARISTRHQDIALQRDALLADGVERIFEDVGSGADRNRPQLRAALEFARHSDQIVIYRLDRLARSTRDLLELADLLRQRGIGLRSLSEALDTATAAGGLLFGVLSVLASFEKDLLAERTRAGLAAARARGRLVGRPKKLDQRDLVAAEAMLANGNITVREVASRLGVGVSTLYRALAQTPSPAASSREAA